MEIIISNNISKLGKATGSKAATLIRQAIAEKGSANISVLAMCHFRLTA